MSIQATSSVSSTARVQAYSSLSGPSAADSAPAADPSDSFESSSSSYDSGNAQMDSLRAMSRQGGGSYQVAARTIGPNEPNPAYPMQRIGVDRCVQTHGSGFAARPVLVPCQ